MTLKFFVASLAVAIGAVSVGSRSRPGAPPSFDRVLDSLVPVVLAKTPASGAVVALVERGQIKLSKGYGLADKGTGRPMTDSTPMPVASVSKLVASWGIVSLAARGELDLDRPVGAMITGWSLPPSPFDPKGVTPRRLLSHTAGLSMLSVPCFPADSARPSEGEVLSGAGDRGKLELTAAPGAQWRYSGGGYTLLQLAVRQRTGQPFPDFMANQVFAPLGMKSTYYGPPKADAPVGYDDNGTPVHPIQCVGEAAAGLVTAARDMAWLLLEYGRARRGESRLLPGRWIDTVATPIARAELEVDGRRIDMGDARMGLGHFIHVTKQGGRMLFHSGGNSGAGAYVLVDLDRDGGLFVAVNSDGAADLLRAILAAWEKFYGVDPPAFF